MCCVVVCCAVLSCVWDVWKTFLEQYVKRISGVRCVVCWCVVLCCVVSGLFRGTFLEQLFEPFDEDRGNPPTGPPEKKWSHDSSSCTSTSLISIYNDEPKSERSASVRLHLTPLPVIRRPHCVRRVRASSDTLFLSIPSIPLTSAATLILQIPRTSTDNYCNH